MEDTKIEFLYLSEEDMIEAGVLDAGKCVDTMGEVMTLLSEGDCMMGGRNRNNHGIQLMFPKKSDIKDIRLVKFLKIYLRKIFLTIPTYSWPPFFIPHTALLQLKYSTKSSKSPIFLLLF